MPSNSPSPNRERSPFAFNQSAARRSDDLSEVSASDFGHYYLRPGEAGHVEFLEYLAEELRNLPLNHEMGKTVLGAGSKQRAALAGIVSMIEDQTAELRHGKPWSADQSRVTELLADGDLAIFRSWIDERHNIDGISYSVDICRYGPNDTRGVLLISRKVTQFPKLQVELDGEIELHLGSGLLELRFPRVVDFPKCSS